MQARRGCTPHRLHGGVAGRHAHLAGGGGGRAHCGSGAHDWSAVLSVGGQRAGGTFGEQHKAATAKAAQAVQLPLQLRPTLADPPPCLLVVPSQLGGAAAALPSEGGLDSPRVPGRSGRHGRHSGSAAAGRRRRRRWLAGPHAGSGGGCVGQVAARCGRSVSEDAQSDKPGSRIGLACGGRAGEQGD